MSNTEARSTLCNTAHPDFPDLVCRINRGDHRDATHRVTTSVGVVEWPMVDTEAEFKRKDAEYFALVGRTVMHLQEVARIIEYKPLRGPAYLFTLQYVGGAQVGSQRDEFYVLPTREMIEQRIRRIYIDGGVDVTHAQEAASEIAVAMLALLTEPPR